MKTLSEKIFKRKMSYLEITTVVFSLIFGFYFILTRSADTVSLLFGVIIIILNIYFIKRKQKDIVLFILMIIFSLLMFSNTIGLFTTVFNPQNISQLPKTYQECLDIGGVAVPQDCASGYVESGNAGENLVCCLLDTCEGEWVRIFNTETKIFEKVCYNG